MTCWVSDAPSVLQWTCSGCGAAALKDSSNSPAQLRYRAARSYLFLPRCRCLWHSGFDSEHLSLSVTSCISDTLYLIRTVSLSHTRCYLVSVLLAMWLLHIYCTCACYLTFGCWHIECLDDSARNSSNTPSNMPLTGRSCMCRKLSSGKQCLQ